MKVRELVEHLLAGNQDAEVGVFGWFGEWLPMDRDDFVFEEVKNGHNPQGHVGWYLQVEQIDRGPEPE